MNDNNTNTTIGDKLKEKISGSSTVSPALKNAVSNASKNAKVTNANAVGRRKEAVARVRLIPGSGQWSINGRTLENYFPNKVHQQLVNSPFVLLGQESKYDVKVNVRGGGISGQAGAVRLGISRALNEADRDANRPELKKAGFLTRDARVVERKKAGLKKARKASQFSKR